MTTVQPPCSVAEDAAAPALVLAVAWCFAGRGRAPTLWFAVRGVEDGAH